MLAAALRADPEAGNLRFPPTPPVGESAGRNAAMEERIAAFL